MEIIKTRTVNPEYDIKELDLTEIFSTIYKSRKMIIIITMLFIICGLIYSFTATPLYKSDTTLILPSDTKSTGLLNQLGGMASMLGMGSSSSNTQMYEGLIKSRRMTLFLIEKFKLFKQFNIENTPKNKEKLITKITKSINAVVDSEKPMMYISVETFSPELSHDIAYEVILKTNKMINNLNIVKASEKKDFLKKRISEIYEEIEELQNKIKKFYKNNGIYELETQSQKTVSAAADLLNEIINLKTKLKIQKESIGSENPEYMANTMMLIELQKRYDKIMKSEKNLNNTLLLPIKAIPNMTFENMELKRELAGQSALLKMLNQQYEMAKIEEKKENMFLRILDPPTLPVNKSKPKRTLIMVVTSVIGFFFSIVLVFLLNFLADLKNKLKNEEIYIS